MENQTITLSEKGKKIQQIISHANGFDDVYAHGFGRYKILLSEGCKHIAEEAGAYWLFDIVSSYQPKLKDEEFQVWKLIKQESRGWKVTCDDGNENILIEQQIEFSDFPLPEIKFYFENNICMLPKER